MNEENKDLVTIPKYIADEIESHSDNPTSASIVSSIVNLFIQDMYNNNIDSWLMNIKNHDILLQAIVHGYTVEKPTLYYVRVLKGDKYSYLNKNFNNGIVALNEMYPTAELLISTIGTDKDNFVYEVCELAKSIDKIGLQFSIHHYDDDKRDQIIPYKEKLTLFEIARVGQRFYLATGKQAFINYIVTDANNTGYERLFRLFAPTYFQFTFSVLCSPNESIKFQIRGYSTRMFDPGGQDDIGGGCGQLWYFQDKCKEIK